MRKGGILLLVGLQVLASLFVLMPKSQAASVWASGVYISDIGLVASTDLNSGNYPCVKKTFSSTYIKNEKRLNGKLVYDTTTTESTGKTYTNICAVQNDHGLMTPTTSTALWSETLDPNRALPIDGLGTYGLLPAPGGKALLFFKNSSSGMDMSFNNNLKLLGSLDTKTYGTGINAVKEKVWKIDQSKLQPSLKYSSGATAYIDQIAYSSNGKYAVIQLKNRGLARLNIETKELTPFESKTPTQGPSTLLQISNNGQFVAVSYGSGVNNLNIHDLAQCTMTFDYGQWPASGVLPTAGCTKASLFESLKLKYPTVQSIDELQFSPNSASLTIVMWKQVGSTQEPRRIRLDALGYTSSANGYLAMGDSFTSGEGDGQGGDWYEPGTDEQGNKDTFAGRNLCHLSRRSYPYLMAVELGYIVTNTTSPESNGFFHSVACSGAKLHNITGLLGEKQDDGTSVDFAVTDNQYRHNLLGALNSWQPGFERQIGFLKGRQDDLVENRAPFNPEAITLGIGGNDVGFGKIIEACITPGDCEFATSSSKKQEIIERFISQKTRLERAYKKIKTDSPDSRIYVVGYPQFVAHPVVTCANNVRFSAAEVRFIHEATHYFNQVIASAAASAGVTFVDVENILDGVNLCSGASDVEMAMNGVTAGNDVNPKGLCTWRDGCFGSESYHPNQKAQLRYKNKILAETNNLTNPNPAIVPTLLPIPSDYFGFGTSYFEGLNNPQSPDRQNQILKEMTIGALDYRQPTVNLGGFLPNSQVSVSIHSEPTQLGNFTVDASGVLNTTVTIPDMLLGGYHELHVTGRDALGQPVDFYEPILLAMTQYDFDGDGVVDAIDSCPAVQNSGVDIDEDGIDDACDESPQAPVVVEPPVEETPPVEEPVDPPPVDPEEQPQPQPEADDAVIPVVANSGTTPPAVLGASTQDQSAVAGLATTGNPQKAAILIGILCIMTPILLFRPRKSTKYSIR